jgi:mannosidase alpha-like ER degradation enhancer 2
MKNQRICGLLLLAFMATGICFSQALSPADSVRQEFLHAWNGYKRHAWGADALQPLSRTPHNWYRKSLCMTPVDAFDTMLMMGLTKEAEEAKELILDSLSFDHDMEVQAFEIVIRLLGGLLSAYEMDGDERFLLLAEDLGSRLLPIYDTRTGIPKRYVNLRTGATRDSINNPAEIGTALLEFGTLSRHTGNREYYEKSKRALVALYNHRSPIGLVGTWINAETGEWTDKRSHIRGAIDSYYEYLIKAWLLFGDEECRTMWEESIQAVHRTLADTLDGNLWYRQADMGTGAEIGTRFGSLDAFFPAVLCLAGDMERAARLQVSANRMWDLHGIEPEAIDYREMKVVGPGYYLRPEIMESAYYLSAVTGEKQYREMGLKYFRALVKYCRTEAGYAYLEDVITKKQGDGMESFFLAETMKYLYLLLGGSPEFSLEDFVFNTEAHPFRKKP